jgi:hypothetical protein
VTAMLLHLTPALAGELDGLLGLAENVHEHLPHRPVGEPAASVEACSRPGGQP